jgi:hypothetical protein
MCRLAWLSATITLSIFCDGTNMIKGSIVAIVTPMHEDGSLRTLLIEEGLIKE